MPVDLRKMRGAGFRHSSPSERNQDGWPLPGICCHACGDVAPVDALLLHTTKLQQQAHLDANTFSHALKQHTPQLSQTVGNRDVAGNEGASSK